MANLQGERQAACSLHEESLAIFKELGDQRGVAISLNHLGDVARVQHEYEVARSRYQESLAIFRRLSDYWQLANSLSDLGDLICEQEVKAAARPFYEESLGIFVQLGDKRGIARLLEKFLVLAAAHGQPERALRLGGAVTQLRASLGAVRSPAEQAKLEHILDSAWQALDETVRTTAWAKGKA